MAFAHFLSNLFLSILYFFAAIVNGDSLLKYLLTD